jgi:hypothetical protein
MSGLQNFRKAPLLNGFVIKLSKNKKKTCLEKSTKKKYNECPFHFDGFPEKENKYSKH